MKASVINQGFTKQIAKNFSPATVTAGSVTEEKLHSFFVPAGLVSTGDLIEIYSLWAMSVSANIKTLRFYINSTDSLAGAVLVGQLNSSTYAIDNIARLMPVISDTSVLVAGTGATVLRSQYGVGTSGTNTNTDVPSLAAGFYIIVSGQKASGAETLTLNFSTYTITRTN